MARDPRDTIRKVAAEGYRYIEAANHNAGADSGVGFGVSAKELRQLLDEAGAEMVSAHIFPMEMDVLSRVLEYHREAGTKFIVWPMDFYESRDAVLKKAEAMNQAGKACKEAGMALLYHNHFHEFQLFSGKTVYDILLENTDPALVGVELDTYWAMRGGQDPAALLTRLGKRARLIHQKDYPAAYRDKVNLINRVNQENARVDMAYFGSVVDEKTFTEIGTGIMDIQSIIDAGNRFCGTEYVILEQDFTQMGEFESIRVSMESFKKFKGIEWE
jgi:sugar phosphate isomerase/epimerase